MLIERLRKLLRADERIFDCGRARGYVWEVMKAGPLLSGSWKGSYLTPFSVVYAIRRTRSN